MIRPMRLSIIAAAVAAVLALSACGSSNSTSSHATSTTTSNAATDTSSVTPPVSPAVAAAERPQLGSFPAPQGRSLQQLAGLVHSTAEFGAATGTFTAGHRRVDFALSRQSGALIYAPTAVYVASSPQSRDVQGPFLAPADPLTLPPQYRSKQYEGPGDIAAVYTTVLPFAHAGTFYVLALAHDNGRLVGAPGEITVARSSKIPDVGQRPPAIATDTLASDHGNISLVTTRIPPENMHSVPLNQVLGKRPVALLFSTPQLCTSRVCGPVTDVMVALQHEFGNRLAFIHEEVYADNNPSKGLRPQMKAFHLQTEPWLFTINRRGVIAARLEGAFGMNEARAAVEAALR